MTALGDDFEARLMSLCSDSLYEVKKLLRTRCAETQLCAVGVLLSCLEKEPLTSSFPLRKFMLDEDVVGFLCDAMASNSWPLLEQVAAALELLLDCDEMLRAGHAVLAAEATQRRAHFLGLMMVGTSPECESALRALLDLLGTLLCRWSEVPCRGARAVSGLCPAQGLLATLRLVMDAAGRSTSPSTILTATRTLLALLGVLDVGAEPGDPASLAARVAACVRAALRALQLLMQHADDQDDDDKDVAQTACQSMCSIASRITQLRASSEFADNDDVVLVLEGLEVEAQKALLELCLPAVVRAARTSIEESLLETTADSLLSGDGWGQPAMTGELLDALLTVLEKGKDPVALADTLACSDFLWLLPTLHRTSPDWTQPLRLLCGVLAHLAHDLLDAASWWRGGATSLAAFLASADALLPIDNREWPRALDRWPYLEVAPPAGREAEAPCALPQAAQLLVLLLGYFRCVVGSDCDPEEVQCISSSLPAYILTLPDGAATTVPDFVLKTVWASFAVHCVLAAAELPPGARAASAKLVLLLEQASVRGEDGAGLRRAYTHHPTLLHWAFQAAAPPRLQEWLLRLWLERRDADAAATDAPVMEIVAAQRQAVHPLLGVVASGGARSARVAARLLSRAVANDAALLADLHAGLWERLPLELSRGERAAAAATKDPAALDAAAAAPPQAEGCGELVWLAARLDAQIPDDLRLRAAHLLAGALAKQRLGAAPRYATSAMYVLTRELLDSRRRGDSRVLVTLLSDERFTQALLAAADHEDFQLCTKAMHLLRQLEEDHALLTAPVVPAPLPYELKSVLFAVTCNNPKVLEAGLRLLLEVLKEKPHPFLALVPDVKSFRMLYFTLQNHVVKFQGTPSLTDAIWTALKDLLPRCDLLPHQPWNHSLIEYTLKLTPLPSLSPQCLAFLVDWLRLVAPEDPPEPTPRRPRPTLLTETATRLASALSVAGQDFLQQTVAKKMAALILGVTANLPPHLEIQMKELAGL